MAFSVRKVLGLDSLKQTASNESHSLYICACGASFTFLEKKDYGQYLLRHEFLVTHLLNNCNVVEKKFKSDLNSTEKRARESVKRMKNYQDKWNSYKILLKLDGACVFTKNYPEQN